MNEEVVISIVVIVGVVIINCSQNGEVVISIIVIVGVVIINCSQNGVNLASTAHPRRCAAMWT